MSVFLRWKTDSATPPPPEARRAYMPDPEWVPVYMERNPFVQVRMHKFRETGVLYTYRYGTQKKHGGISPAVCLSETLLNSDQYVHKKTCVIRN